MTNIEKLNAFIMERNPELIPIYLKVLEIVLPPVNSKAGKENSKEGKE